MQKLKLFCLDAPLDIVFFVVEQHLDLGHSGLESS